MTGLLHDHHALGLLLGEIGLHPPPMALYAKLVELIQCLRGLVEGLCCLSSVQITLPKTPDPELSNMNQLSKQWNH